MTEEKASVLYDADAVQQVPVAVVQDGANYKITHHFEGINDSGVVAILDAPENARAEAVSVYWRTGLKLITGYEEGDISQAEDFDAVTLDERLTAINDGLLLTVVEQQPASGKPKLRGSAVQTYHLKSFFDGQFVQTKIKLSAYDADHYRVWQRAKAGSYPVKFGDHRLSGIGSVAVALFDALLSVGAEGYAGRIPPHHKAAVIEAHFDGQSAALLAKK